VERLFQRFSRLLREDDIRGFQYDVAAAIYDQLSRGYLSNEDEVALVRRIVQATNGKSYGPLRRIDVANIHGGRSCKEEAAV
jgi:hypothetical protein